MHMPGPWKEKNGPPPPSSNPSHKFCLPGSLNEATLSPPCRPAAGRRYSGQYACDGLVTAAAPGFPPRDQHEGVRELVRILVPTSGRT